MRYFFILLTLTAILLTEESGHTISAFSKSKMDVEFKFVVLEFPKYEKYKIQEMLTELHSYQGKINDAKFDFTTHRLTVHYFASISLDDILQIVSTYNMDFTKITGSEIE